MVEIAGNPPSLDITRRKIILAFGRQQTDTCLLDRVSATVVCQVVAS